MKKLTTKLLISVLAVVLALTTLGTSTFAWFSMNASVSATGMSVTAKNESGSLIIGAQTYTSGTKNAVPTLTSVQTANLTTVALGEATYNYTSDFSVSPCTHTSQSTIANLDSVANWSYKTADAPSSYASSAATGTALTTFAGYVIYYDLYITVAKGSPDMANLKCNATIQESGATNETRKGVRVLVASDSAAEEFYQAHVEGTTDTQAKTTGTEILSNTISASSLVHIKVYIYIDGEDSTVFTNNVGNLTSCSISLSFTAAEVE